MTFYGIPGFGPPFSGWAIYAILIFFLGTSHPPPSEELSSLGKSRFGVGALTGLILLTTFTPSPIFAVDSPFSLDIEVDETNFHPVLSEYNQTSLRILNNGQSEGWDNITVKMTALDNFTLVLRVDYVNISDKASQFNSTSAEFPEYVAYDGANLTLNLTAGSYANLTLTISPNDQFEAGEYTFDLEVSSRTERVYRTTFALAVEEQD